MFVPVTVAKFVCISVYGYAYKICSAATNQDQILRLCHLFLNQNSTFISFDN